MSPGSWLGSIILLGDRVMHVALAVAAGLGRVGRVVTLTRHIHRDPRYTISRNIGSAYANAYANAYACPQEFEILHRRSIYRK